MFQTNFSTARRYCLAMLVLTATALLAPSGQPTTSTSPASAVKGTGVAAVADRTGPGH